MMEVRGRESCREAIAVHRGADSVCTEGEHSAPALGVEKKAREGGHRDYTMTAQKPH